MKAPAAFVLTLLAWPSSAVAEYKVDVVAKPNFAEGLSRVVVVASQCHQSLNCRDIESQVIAKIPKIAPKIRAVPAAAVHQALLELGEARYRTELRNDLIAKFQATAVIEMDILYGEKGVVGFTPKGSASAISLRLIDTSGTLLMSGEGSGRARNSLSSPENVAREIVERILEKAFK